MKKREFKKGFNKLLSSRFSPAEIQEIGIDAKKEILKIKLSELRRIMHVTQQEIKGFSQPAVASLEKRNDMKLSTLVNYLSKIGMGMEIKVFAKRPRATVPKEMILLKF
ncbi:MAG: hypothetical protein PHC61_18680 [Chitinivibrionales bacterium]|nr:hypothetical protein [Chitinivibrionales bacterium]